MGMIIVYNNKHCQMALISRREIILWSVTWNDEIILPKSDAVTMAFPPVEFC